VNVSEVFTANKKRGEHINPFKVVNHPGQLYYYKARYCCVLTLKRKKGVLFSCLQLTLK